MEKVILTKDALKIFLRILLSTPTCKFTDLKKIIDLYQNPQEIEIERLIPLVKSGGPLTLLSYAQENSLEKLYPHDLFFLFGGNFHIRQVEDWLKNGQIKNNFWQASEYQEEHFFGDIGNILVVKEIINNEIEAFYQNDSLKIEAKGLLVPSDLILKEKSYILAHFVSIVAICDVLTAQEILHLHKKNPSLVNFYSSLALIDYHNFCGSFNFTNWKKDKKI